MQTQLIWILHKLVYERTVDQEVEDATPNAFTSEGQSFLLFKVKQWAAFRDELQRSSVDNRRTSQSIDL